MGSDHDSASGSTGTAGRFPYFMVMVACIFRGAFITVLTGPLLIIAFRHSAPMPVSQAIRESLDILRSVTNSSASLASLPFLLTISMACGFLFAPVERLVALI